MDILKPGHNDLKGETECAHARWEWSHGVKKRHVSSLTVIQLNRLLASSGEAVYKVMSPDVTCPYANSTCSPEVYAQMDGWMYSMYVSMYRQWKKEIINHKYDTYSLKQAWEVLFCTCFFNLWKTKYKTSQVLKIVQMSMNMRSSLP